MSISSITLFISFCVGFLPLISQAKDRVIWQNKEEQIVWRDIEGESSPLVLVGSHGREELLMPPDSGFGYDDALRKGGKISLLGGTALGEIHYWCLEKRSNEWRISHEAALGPVPIMPFGIAKLELSDIDHIVGTSGDPTSNLRVAIEVTEIPLLPNLPGHPAHLVLMNGQIFKQDFIPGAVWDQPLEKIRKDHEARKKAAQDTKASKGSAGGSAGSFKEGKTPSPDSSLMLTLYARDERAVLSSYQVSEQIHLSLEWEKKGDGGVYSLHLSDSGRARKELWAQQAAPLAPAGILLAIPGKGSRIVSVWWQEQRATILIGGELSMAMLIRVDSPYSEKPKSDWVSAEGIFDGSGINAEPQVKFTSANDFEITRNNLAPVKVTIGADGNLYSQGKKFHNEVHVVDPSSASLPPDNSENKTLILNQQRDSTKDGRETHNSDSGAKWRWFAVVIVTLGVMAGLIVLKRRYSHA